MFGQPTISDLYRQILEKTENEILSEKDRFILETDTEDLVEHFTSKYNLTPITVDESRGQEAEYRKRMQRVPARQRDEIYRYLGDKDFEYESIRVSIPLIHNPDINVFLKFGPSTWSPSWSIDEYDLTPDSVSFEFDIRGYQFDYKQDPNKIPAMIEQGKKRILEWFGWVNSDIAKESPNLRTQINNFINQRRAKLQQDKTFIAELNTKVNIPVKIKDDETAKKIILNPVPLVRKVAPRPTLSPEYVLDKQMVLDIIAFIDNQGRQFEKTPRDYSDSDETKLRNILLVSLNSIFRSKATGETFSNKGKTDIYLNIDEGNILVCECKIWAGQALYHSTINQLIGYLTWRNNFGIMITFVRKKSLTKILEEIPTIITSHPNYVNGFQKISDTHFISHNHLDQDTHKNVELHHLFYNLYSE